MITPNSSSKSKHRAAGRAEHGRLVPDERSRVGEIERRGVVPGVGHRQVEPGAGGLGVGLERVIVAERRRARDRRAEPRPPRRQRALFAGEVGAVRSPVAGGVEHVVEVLHGGGEVGEEDRHAVQLGLRAGAEQLAQRHALPAGELEHGDGFVGVEVEDGG
jgi:hypothetical protein